MKLNILLLCFLFAVINIAGCNTIKREAAKTTKKLKKVRSRDSTFILLGGDDDEGGDDEDSYAVFNNNTLSGSGSGSGWVVTEVGSGEVITEVGSGGVETGIGSGEVVTEIGSGEDDNESGDVVTTENLVITTPSTTKIPIKTTSTIKTPSTITSIVIETPTVNITSFTPTANKVNTTAHELTTTKSTTIKDKTTKVLTTTTTTTTEETTAPTKVVIDARSKYIDAVYNGSCKCSLGFNELYREEYRSALPGFDFIYLVKKHPNGVFSVIFNVKHGELKFTDGDYLRINAPLPCGCFIDAPNVRYLIGGRLQDGKVVIDKNIPLYKITSMDQLRSILQV